ncbi:MAG: carbohydrate ABC transporter permease, partial [Treponema sp.]|nr:carbohydrate ABC transporter permease [Treponema sp.]
MDDRNVSPIFKFVIYLIMVLFAILAVYPIFWLIIQSFKTTQEYLLTNKLSFPKTWYFANYPYIWRVGKFGTLFLNSVFYSFVTVGSVVVLALMAGFAFAKLNFKITPFLHGLFIIGILLTLQSIMVPLFLMVNAVKLYNTRIGVLIPYIGLGLPMGVY